MVYTCQCGIINAGIQKHTMLVTTFEDFNIPYF